MLKALSILVMVHRFPPVVFTTHVSPSSSPVTESLKMNFQVRWSLEAPSGPS